MPASTFAGHAILNLLLRGVAFEPPARVYVSLHTADPGNAGVDEVSTGTWPSYLRQDPADGGAVASGFTAPDGKASVNAKQLLFARNNGADPVTVSHFAIWDAQTGGNCLQRGVLVDPLDPEEELSKTINRGDECVIYPGEMLVVID